MVRTITFPDGRDVKWSSQGCLIAYGDRQLSISEYSALTTLYFHVHDLTRALEHIATHTQGRTGLWYLDYQHDWRGLFLLPCHLDQTFCEMDLFDPMVNCALAAAWVEEHGWGAWSERQPAIIPS